MKTSITIRDLKWFFLGILFIFLMQTILGQNDIGEHLRKGFIEGIKISKQK